MKKALTVYKASAGSGKTFTLAYNYIRKLIDNPTAAGTILAVTFTNKATAEMKTRILSQLWGLWRGLDDSGTTAFMGMLEHDTALDRQTISAHAETALKNIIYDYNNFHVETIDAFFQKVLMNLARELELTPNLHVDLNEQQVEEKAVDTMIDRLTPTDDTLKWIMEYIDTQMSDDKDWNIINKLKRFGKNLFNDNYKEKRDEITRRVNDSDFFKSYTSALHAISTDSEKRLKQPAEEFERILQREGLNISDFTKGASGPCGYFIKLGKGIYDGKDFLNNTILAAMDDAKKWVRKADAEQGSRAFDVAKNQLIPLIKASEAERKKLLRKFKSADVTLRHMHQLRLLNAINEEIQRENKDTNRFFLSETQTLLHSMMKESDAPFIFEKIGARFQHIMIDEFQDTNHIQWRNFMVLMLECMSHANSQNLIVGDVKQSIYRWRNGDWRLLNNIEKQFENHEEQLATRNLNVNYRSQPVIVDFNNTFFKTAASIECNRLKAEGVEGSEQIERAYRDVEQQAAKANDGDGYVNVRLFPKENYDNATMQYIKECIEKTLSAGYTYNDIAIIVRKNDDIQRIAECLSREMEGIPFLSDEAFRLDASEAVNIIIDALRLIVEPSNTLLVVSLAKAYQRLMDNELSNDDIIAGKDKLERFLPEEFVQQMNTLQSLPFTELVSDIYRFFNLHLLEKESAFVCTLFDNINQFVNDNGIDIRAFLKYWDEKLCSESIQSDNANGIRLLTIHKSKGLQYENVIMPLCDWQLEKYGSVLWCEPETPPFDRLPLVPVDFSPGQMKETVYEARYFDEHLQNTMDNLNLLYVGFTRAKRNLFISCRSKGKTNERNALIQSTLAELNKIDATANEGDTIEVDFGTFCIPPDNSEKEASRNIFTMRPKKISLENHVYESTTVFVESNRSREFTDGDDSLSQTDRYIKTGTVLHKIFSMIETVADIDSAIMSLENDGVLYGEGLSKERIRKMIHSRMENPTVADWFSGEWKTYNECTLLTVSPEGETVQKRPDRVMVKDDKVVVVDFKFGSPKEEYVSQVCTYMTLLKDMGFKNVSGYLWYVYTNTIDKVE